MKLEELNKILKRNAIERKYEIIKYTMENNTVSVGDIVSNGRHTILVDDITYGVAIYSRCDYGCLYKGDRLTKKLRPFKRPQRGAVSQSSMNHQTKRE